MSIFHMSVHFIKVELPLSFPKDKSIIVNGDDNGNVIICRRVWNYGAFLLSYCGEQITIQQSAGCEENSFRSKRMRLLMFVI